MTVRVFFSRFLQSVHTHIGTTMWSEPVFVSFVCSSFLLLIVFFWNMSEQFDLQMFFLLYVSLGTISMLSFRFLAIRTINVFWRNCPTTVMGTSYLHTLMSVCILRCCHDRRYPLWVSYASCSIDMDAFHRDVLQNNIRFSESNTLRHQVISRSKIVHYLFPPSEIDHLTEGGECPQGRNRGANFWSSPKSCCDAVRRDLHPSAKPWKQEY